MANATYVSPVINTQAKEIAALNAAKELIEHVIDGLKGRNNYPAHLFSLVFDQGTNIITIVLSGPLPNLAQTVRYNLTAV